MIFKEVPYDSPDYRNTLVLRETILRIPIGLKMSAQDMQNEDQQLHFTIFDDTDLVACVVVKPLDSIATVKLRQMAVAESFQGRNIGQRLIIDTEKALITRGCKSIELHARKTAIGFYNKLGYEIIGDDFIEQGIPHIKMHKALHTGGSVNGGGW